MARTRALSTSAFDTGLTGVSAVVAGFLTLAVQIICTRVAIQYFGSESTTIAAIIAMSLVGLAIGALCVGRLADSMASIDRWIGVLFWLSAAVIFGVSEFGASTAVKIETAFNSGVTENGLPRVLFAALTMVPINLALGGILPCLVRRGSGSDKFQNSFGWVYAAETAGAAIGSLLTAFWLIQSVGLLMTLRGCALLAVGTGCVFVFLGGSINSKDGDEVVENADSTPAISRVVFFLVVAANSFAALGMEVVWQRHFVVWFGSDTQSYAIVVMTYLLGIALGALVSNFVLRLGITNRVYSIVLVLSGIAMLSTTCLLSLGLKSPLLQSAVSWLTESPFAARLILAISVMILPTTLIGLGLPLAVAIWQGGSRNIGKKMGQVYSAALIGNVLGVLGCGFLLLPSFGLGVSAVVLSGLCIVSGLAINFVSVGRKSIQPNQKQVLFGTALFVFVGSWLIFARSAREQELRDGWGRSDAIWSYDYYSEKANHTVAVIHEKSNPEKRMMLIDGVSIGESQGGVEEKQVLLAHLPFLVQRADTQRKILTIGLGTGILSNEILKNPEAGALVCVELSPLIIEAAGIFADQNGEVLKNEKFQLVRADGFQYLRRSEEKFDGIVSDAKSRPGHAGNVAFFSRDYYQLCDEKLSDVGIFVQWISLKTSRPALETILKTFAGVFPYGHVAIVAPDSIFVIGSKSPLRLDRETFSKYLGSAVGESLNRFGFNHGDDVLSLYWLDQKVILDMLDGVQISTLDRPTLERFALDSVAISTQKSPRQLDLIDALLQCDTNQTAESARPGELHELDAGRQACREILQASRLMLELEENWLDAAAANFKRAKEWLPGLTRQSGIAEIYRQLARTAGDEDKVNLEFSALLNVRELGVANALEEHRLGMILHSLGKNQEALEYFYAAIKKAPDEPKYRLQFAFCLLDLGKAGQASGQFRRILADNEDSSEARLGLGVSQLRLGNMAEASENISRALREDQGLVSRLDELGISFDDFCP